MSRGKFTSKAAAGWRLALADCRACNAGIDCRASHGGRSQVTFFHFIWNDEIAGHIAEHGISQDDFEFVVTHCIRKGMSRSTGLPTAWGYTVDGRYIMAVYERLDRVTILPVTAYEIPEPK